MGWNSTTHYWTCYGVMEAGPEEEDGVPVVMIMVLYFLP